jgi:hypothetical protein
VSTSDDDALAALATALADKHNALVRVLFKAESLHGVLLAHRVKWLTEARKELEEAWADALAIEPYFVQVLGEVAQLLGLPMESTLREVAQAAGEPWGFIFAQNREEILDAAKQIEQLSEHNRTMLARGHLALAAALKILGGNDLRTYDQLGTVVGRSDDIHIIDVRS